MWCQIDQATGNVVTYQKIYKQHPIKEVNVLRSALFIDNTMYTNPATTTKYFMNWAKLYYKNENGIRGCESNMTIVVFDGMRRIYNNAGGIITRIGTKSSR